DVVTLLAREDDPRDTDVEPVARGQDVRVDRRPGVSLDVVLVTGAEEPWFDERAGRGADDRHAEVRDRLVGVHVVELLAAALGRLRPAGGGGGAPGGRPGAAMSEA